MVCDFFKTLYSFDMSPYYSLFFFKYTDIRVDLRISKLFVFEGLKSCGYDSFALVVKQDMLRSSSSVIDFKLCPHRLVNPPQQTSHKDYVSHRFAFKLANIIRPR